jgi:hypothetical protein
MPQALNLVSHPVERLKEVLSYDPLTGSLIWIAQTASCGPRLIGKEAGCPQKGPDGHRVVRVDGRLFLVHRLVWAMHTGAWSEYEIDHRNGIKTDNRIANLRECKDGILNAQNTHGPRRHNTSGFAGVVKHKQCKSDRWVARITVDGKQVHLGLFATPEEAHARYLTAKRERHLAAR